MESDILVDSNVFIDLLKVRKDPAKTIGEWAGMRELATCGMVRLEVLRGIKIPRLYQSVANFMDVMINVRSDTNFWQESAALAWKLDRQGKVIPGTDIIIAVCAMRIGATVLTSDRHFHGIDGLQAVEPPEEWFA